MASTRKPDPPAPPEAEAEADELATEIPIDGTLDLHTFRPAEVKGVVSAYLDACAARGIREVRIVHGKGTGTLRRTVESLLQRLPQVESFRPADESAGGWGATLVTLRQGPNP